MRLFFKSKQEHFTIRQGAEDSCRAEAAVTSQGARPDLHVVLRGPAEVCQHHLVSFSLCVQALTFTEPLLPKQNEKKKKILDWI